MRISQLASDKIERLCFQAGGENLFLFVLLVFGPGDIVLEATASRGTSDSCLPTGQKCPNTDYIARSIKIMSGSLASGRDE